MTDRLTLIVLLLVTAWIVVCTQQNHMSVNPASRYATMDSLVERGTWSIDGSSLRTVDKVQIDGKMYSSKPPLMVALMTPAYALVRAVHGFGFNENAYQTVRAMRLLVGVSPWLLAMLAWLGLVRRLTDDPVTQLWASTAMIAGGLSTAYASHLDNHSVAMAALLVGAVLLCPILRGRINVARAFAGGLVWGFATTCDLGAIPGVGLIGLACIWLIRSDRRAVAALVAGLLIAPLAQTVLLLVITGDPRPFYLRTGIYDYAGSYWRNPIEFDALDEPWPVYAFHALLGHHGLFSVTPWLLLALPWFFQREDTEAAELLRKAAAGATVFVVGYYIFRTNNYGGRCVGMRWFMVLHPILAIAAVRTVVRRDLVSRRPILLGVLTGWSAINALLGAINPWEEGLMYATFRAIGLGSVAG